MLLHLCLVMPALCMLDKIYRHNIWAQYIGTIYRHNSLSESGTILRLLVNRNIFSHIE